MKVSIIIPIYNVSNYIEECLLSALNQTYNSIEVLLIDDASTDDSFIKAKNIVLRHTRGENAFFLVHEKNKGLSAARNTGIKASTGDYLFFLDSDDILPLDAIENLVYAAGNDNPDFVIGEFTLQGSRDRVKYPVVKLCDATVLRNNKIADNLYLKKWHGMAWNKLVRKDVIFNYACFFYEGLLHEDILWSFYLAINSSKMIVCKKNTYIYRIRNGSITHQVEGKRFDSLEIVFSEMLRISKEKDIISNPLFFKYLIDLKIYFFKELLRTNQSIFEISKRITKVNLIFREYNKCFNPLCSVKYNMKLLAYKLPIKLACIYVKLSI
ncbi:glycosyltransferase family 2 protein [Parabacteroides sp. AM08-6]|uniref:glycosyltransferase family 2 protein n=1 Tax=Parabacteroides sp. AM08-6 TaxID=2292053 RepID=UPI000F00C552|nr:glycosyltransferase family 2 protein [Parabacteroides sp. AM08-6]RHJ79746.1 glycosyltransferase family 2 protein [Parabacteroides sp. AM08-6]